MNSTAKYSLLILSIILFQLNKSESRPDKSATKTCLIQNTEYKDEYLYSCFKLDATDDFKRKIYTNPIETTYMRTFTQLKWKFEPVVVDVDGEKQEDNNQTYYYISNSQYNNEYMCASNNHFDRFSYRRKVNLNKLTETGKNDKRCMWRLDEQPHHENRYMIWNAFYNEAIYAAMDLLSEAKTNRRNVYTWYKNPDSRQFIWNLICL
jgi:hypothetical protein